MAVKTGSAPTYSNTVAVSAPVTAAGKAFSLALTAWLQDTRLMSEAAYRLSRQYKKEGTITFATASWPKPEKPGLPLKDFKMGPTALQERTSQLLKNLWSTRFVFLETLWEEYLEDLVKELRLRDAAIFEPFVEREFMVDIVRDVLTERLNSVDEIKQEVASRFAAGLTRQSWEQQWKQLSRLGVGLSAKDNLLPWWPKLDIYFEMRNCIIHRQARVSPALFAKDEFYSVKGLDRIEVWPPQLDFFRHQFIACLLYMEACIDARFKAAAVALSI